MARKKITQTKADEKEDGGGVISSGYKGRKFRGPQKRKANRKAKCP